MTVGQATTVIRLAPFLMLADSLPCAGFSRFWYWPFSTEFIKPLSSYVLLVYRGRFKLVFLSPQESLLIAQENNILGIFFSYFIMKMFAGLYSLESRYRGGFNEYAQRNNILCKIVANIMTACILQLILFKIEKTPN